MLDLASNQYMIIHVGSPKTGSTAIQQLLFGEREFLCWRYGLLYPTEHIIDDGLVRSRRANGSLLLPEYYDSVKLGPLFDQWFAKSPHVILSEELLFLAQENQRLVNLRNDRVKICIVCYLRNPADYLSSLWGEFQTKETGLPRSELENFLHSDELVNSLLAQIRLMNARPEFEFLIRPYPSNEHHLDSVRDFMSILGLAGFVSNSSRITVNISLTRKQIDIYNLIRDRRWNYSGRLDYSRIIALSQEIKSGDDRAIIETISDEMIERITIKHELLLKMLMLSKSNGDRLNLIPYPKCFGVIRDGYQTICPSEYDRLKSLL